MDITDQVALVTGANRGIGRRFVDELLARGARKVYATARRTDSAEARELAALDRVEVLSLDITDHASVVAAARTATDVTLLINNAGISTATPLVTGDLDVIRREMDTHFWGTLDMIREFAPTLAAAGGGAVVNVLSALSWFSFPGNGAYAAAKAAEWNMTNGVRLDLAAQGTLVQGVHLGAADTDIMAGYDGPMIDPAVVPRASFDGLAAGAIEVVVDEWSSMVKASLAHDPAALYAQIAPAA
ncbi:SDR family NAD(P)-dependent oxidoreductase [Arthrobacter sp. NamB2]|uniref:SDR family oxidoreductase n=1 Tax=Arthrobacter sp. NamB2 TaxID=2576035 RepID=UPI0010C9DCA9|nr:SDR family oxidoreductase [Arthrobacter sp. NamB2]TKV26886.1 SDR family NAD(P)-dependent oxidoreductase [Arthrobacter sp. NamB2]